MLTVRFKLSKENMMNMVDFLEYDTVPYFEKLYNWYHLKYCPRVHSRHSKIHGFILKHWPTRRVKSDWLNKQAEELQKNIDNEIYKEILCQTEKN